MSKQVSTHPTTIEAIMASREFAMLVTDARAKRGYPRDVDTWHSNDLWNYERGRQWAALAPRSVALKRGGKLTAAAKSWYRDEII